MQLYPFTSPIVLNDSIFVENGGQTGTFTPAQRNAAYLAAEIQATQYVGTLLKPTIVTGTFGYNGSNYVVTDYGYVHRILSAKVINIENLDTCTLTTKDLCAYIWNDTFGYLHVKNAMSVCGCGSNALPYQYQMVYEAGLPTGTSTLSPFLLALTIAAQLFLNEISYPSANESAGDSGVESFSIGGGAGSSYSEKRKTLKRTSFGQSARSNYIAHLIDSTVTKARRALYF